MYINFVYLSVFISEISIEFHTFYQTMSEEKKILNVLVLGETGVGKSTFINAFLNYLTYSNLSKAAEHDLSYLIPTKFSILDNEFTETVVQIGSNTNELDLPGVSATQNPVSYLFNLKDKNSNLRIIDTPGIGDTRGMKYDERNTENLLTFISELEYLNCICILLKPNNSRLDVLFNYCIKHILLRLDRNVRPNIVFLFTNARSSFYTPGDTLRPLEIMLDDISSNKVDEKIPLNSHNIFCVDNESFRYLAAKSKGMSFSQSDIDLYNNSWNRSSATCTRFVNYIASLPQIPMQGILSVNESRRIVGRLAKPAIELMVLHEKAIALLDKHKADLNKTKDNIDDLRKMLYIPETSYIVGEKTTYSEEKHTINQGLSFSFLPPFVTVKLGYKYSKNQISEKHVVAVEKLLEDPLIKSSLETEANVRDALKKQIEAMAQLTQEYKQEGRTILTAAANFTKFLKENAILFGRDPLEVYLKDILEEEETANEDPLLLENLRELLVKYQVKRDYTYNVLPEDIQKSMSKLLALKHSGQSFKFFYEKKYIFDDISPTGSKDEI